MIDCIVQPFLTTGCLCESKFRAQSWDESADTKIKACVLNVLVFVVMHIVSLNKFPVWRYK